MKCKVIDCENDDAHGNFIGELCLPCFYYITLHKGKHSQAYRNSVHALKLLDQLSGIKFHLEQEAENGRDI